MAQLDLVESIKCWLKSDRNLMDMVDDRVFSPVLPESNYNMPAIVFAFIGGNEDEYIPVADPTVIFKVFTKDDFDLARKISNMLGTLMHAKNMIQINGLDPVELAVNGSLDSTDITRPIVWTGWTSDGGESNNGWDGDEDGGVTVAAFAYRDIASGSGEEVFMRQTVSGLKAHQHYVLTWASEFEDAGVYERFLKVEVIQDGETLATVTDSQLAAPLSENRLPFATKANVGSPEAEVELVFSTYFNPLDDDGAILLDDVSLLEFKGVVLSGENTGVPQEFIERTTGRKFSQSTFKLQILTQP